MVFIIFASAAVAEMVAVFGVTTIESITEQTVVADVIVAVVAVVVGKFDIH